MYTPTRLILVDPKPALCAAWRAAFDGCAGVEVVCGRFEDVPTWDCLVSPANSFGMMDGGVDAAISHYFGWSLMARVQEQLRVEHLGEQPVGTSMLVRTEHPAHPWLAHTPTMRVPKSIAGTDAVYLAMSAMLKAVARHQAEPPIHTVLCPGLGTGWGEVSPASAAAQMALAWRVVHAPEPPDWATAQRREALVAAAGRR